MPKGNKGVLALANEAINVAWAAEGAFSLLERAVTAAWAHIPTFTHGIAVTVAGGPNADLRRCWYLACAVAFGRIRRSPALRNGSATMEATWDISGKVAKIELLYQIARTAYSEDTPRPSDTGKSIAPYFEALFPAALAGAIPRLVAGVPVVPPDRKVLAPAAALAPTDSPITLIQTGPDQISVGGGWPGFLLRHDQVNAPRPRPPRNFIRDTPPVANPYVVTVLTRNNIEGGPTGGGFGGLFREWPRGTDGQATFLPFQIIEIQAQGVTPLFAGTGVNRIAAPTLPDDGRLITTGEKGHRLVQAPKPCVDGATRSSLLALVAAELSEPCFLPEAPGGNTNPLYSTGFRLYPAGASTPGGHASVAYANLSNTVLNAVNADSESEADNGVDGIGIPATVMDFRP